MIIKKYTQVVSILIIVAAIYYSFYSLTPSKSYKATNETAFSTENALVHLKKITKKPHFTGSPEHKVVRDYLVNEFEKIGLQVEIQEQVAVNKKWRAATNNRNILARIKGSENGKALLLLSHYDSNPHSSLGASDAGSGVVVILESIRAFLAKNKQPKNDIIICISDAEELGLLGANAFVNHHPWAKEIGLVLNFEARGSGGPSYMLLETNGGNKNLIEAFQNAETPFPVGNSLMYSIYKMLPNDTDLTVFREDANIDGFNFAFIGDHFDYHTEQDSFERIDLKSLNHQASYLITLLDYFADSNLNNLKATTDYVFFNFPYFGLIFYPFSWVLPIIIFCTALFLILFFVGFFKKKLTVIGILKGFIPFVLSLIISGILAFYGWKLLLKIHPKYNDILHGFTYNGYYYIAVFVAFTLAICFWFYKGFFKKRSVQDLLIAPLFLWILINGAIAFYLPGASFFILPVVILLTILSILIFSNSKENTIVLFTLFAIPVLIVFVPLVKMFPVGLGLKMLVISTVFTVLLFGFLVPVFQQYSSSKKLANIFLLVGAMALISASINASYSDERKEPNSIIYVFDTNLNEAYWASYNSKIDDFTQQFLGDNPTTGSYDSNTTASKYKTKIKLHKKTAVLEIAKPSISVVSDTVINLNREIKLQIASNRNANKVELLSKSPIKFKQFSINGENLKKKDVNNTFVFEVEKGTVLSYFITSENELINLEFVVDMDQKFDIDILESKFDLFSNSQIKIQPRTESMIPMPFVLNDATVIKTNLKF
ncbi:peptidase M28-like protein [Lutibacter oceani]|uniref:Vacuolar membrane protease n=1 Tax=Lutibacter oceani TaxID=1853311 RepID=A0A3D9S4M6_9FLAO|nr:M28 family peptidase [Lutibacter oceani]REE83805.1 peptidase M28-like protein [Lutibacter oceani]